MNNQSSSGSDPESVATQEAAEAISSPAAELFNEALDQALSQGASDLHIEPSAEGKLVLRTRIDGVLRQLQVIPKALSPLFISVAMLRTDLAVDQRVRPQQARTQKRWRGQTIDIRTEGAPSIFGYTLTLRFLLPSQAMGLSLAELGMSPQSLTAWQQSLDSPYGMMIVTGPTGSGKTSSLYASLLQLDGQQRKIITAEDPIEYRLANSTQLQINPAQGFSMRDGMATALRLDADIIMLGEIRDEQTLRSFYRAASSGHLCLSSMFSTTAEGLLRQLLSMGLSQHQISDSLRGVLAQRLARKLCDHCKQPDPETDQLGDWLGREVTQAYQAAPEGCERCSYGYRGRILLSDVLDLELEQDWIVDWMSSNRSPTPTGWGTKRLIRDGVRLIEEGRTSRAELERVVAPL